VLGTSPGRLIGGALIIPDGLVAVLVVRAFGVVAQAPCRAPAFSGGGMRRAAGVDYYRDGPSWCAWSVRGVPGDDAGRDGIAEAALDMSVIW
jgi:hypothetical protein